MVISRLLLPTLAYAIEQSVDASRGFESRLEECPRGRLGGEVEWRPLVIRNFQRRAADPLASQVGWVASKTDDCGRTVPTRGNASILRPGRLADHADIANPRRRQGGRSG